MQRDWPSTLAGSPAVAVIERAIQSRRLSHSLLLQGDDATTLEGVAYAIADRLLADDSGLRFPSERHPDCFSLRPSGKLRLITAEAIRELIAKVQVSASLAPRKVAILREADRMNPAASNIFLKTLEEPPPNTVLILLSTRPYALLPTIRSRVLHFRFPGTSARIAAEGWPQWIADYQALLGRLIQGVPDKAGVADGIFSAYGLVSRFSLILEQASSLAWASQKEALAAELDDDEQIAIETGIRSGLRARLLAEIEQATRGFALPSLEQADGSGRRSLVLAIEKLEHVAGLLRVNLNEQAALEEFFLASLRLWSKRSA